MKYYAWNDMEGLHIWTEEEIIIFYFPYWIEGMKKVKKDHLISLDACIDDFIVCSWAWEV